MRYCAVVILCIFIQSGCVYIPLPDQAPHLQEVRLPQPGDSAAGVRRIFGRPQLLDSGRFLIYDWTTDWAFVVVAVAHGMAGATVSARQQFRMIVVLDDAQRVARVDCSASGLSQQELTSIGCSNLSRLPPTDLRATWREITGNPGLADSRFWHPEMTGTNTHTVFSRNGGLLAASDVNNQTWIIDLENFTLMGRVKGIEPNFWSIKGVSEPRAAFDSTDRRLVVAQAGAVSFLLRKSDRFVPEGGAIGLNLTAIRYACCSDQLMGIGPDGIASMTPAGEVSGHIAEEGRLIFDVSGVKVSRPAPAGANLVAALSSSSLSPSLRAVFGENGESNVVLDGRNDFARHRSPANFEFSPGGQWLARNSCAHLELWSAEQLRARLSEQDDREISPFQSMPMALPEQTAYERECHGPIAFSPEGTRVAAASRSAIHVWDIASGQQRLWLGVATEGARRHVVVMAFAGEFSIKAVVSDQRGGIFLVSWDLRHTGDVTPAGAGNDELKSDVIDIGSAMVPRL